MTPSSFTGEDLKAVNEALEIAEDRTGNFYRFSFDQWKRHRYDVKTLSGLKEMEITSNAFALLNKCSSIPRGIELKTRGRDFYFICLQDHQILKALERDTNLTALPLLVYIFTHELVHIVRFCNFFQRYELSGLRREIEEKVVHTTTFQILKNLSLPNLDYVLEAYGDHRVCEMAVV
jgi:hypothetical protein